MPQLVPAATGSPSDPSTINPYSIPSQERAKIYFSAHLETLIGKKIPIS